MEFTIYRKGFILIGGSISIAMITCMFITIASFQMCSFEIADPPPGSYSHCHIHDIQTIRMFFFMSFALAFSLILVTMLHFMCLGITIRKEGIKLEDCSIGIAPIKIHTLVI